MLQRTLFFIGIIAITASSALALNFEPPLNQGIQFPRTNVGEVSEVVMTVSEDDDRVPQRIDFRPFQNQVFSVNPAQFQIEGGQRIDVTFTFEPREAGVVEERATVTIATANGNIEMREYPISGEGFAGFPEIRVDPMDIELALGAPGEHVEEAVSISNGGLADLEFQIEIDEAVRWLSVEPMEDLVQPDDATELRVSTTDFVPVQGEYSTMLRIHSNDPEQELVEVEVSLSVGFEPALTLDPDLIDEQLGTDSNADIAIEARNTGDEGIAFNIERKLVGDQNAAPWDERYNVNYEEQLEDNGLQAAVIADGFFFVTSSNGVDGTGKVYQLSPEGEVVGEFAQFVESRYGMRDLAYDGNLIWGLDGAVIYGFTTAGELESTVDVPGNLSVRCITWDTDNSYFWLGNITNDFFAVDLDGNLIRTVERNIAIRAYGLAYWADDPDGYCLYLAAPGVEQDVSISKVNLENGDFELVTELSCGSARPSGLDITNRYDALSWVLISLVQTPDRVAVWQLDTNLDWFNIDTENAALEAGNSQDLTLTLDTEGLSAGVFEGEFVFTLDNAGGQTTLPVTLNVEDGGPEERVIDLVQGWSLVSTNVVPEDDDIIRIMRELVAADLLILMKDGAGRFYSPIFGLGNIPGWDVASGYMIKVTEACALTMRGMPVAFDEPIPLEMGWNMVAYYPREPVDAIIALSGIVDQLIMAKDGNGRFYSMDFGFCNMRDWIEGFGYQIKVEEDVELVYRTEPFDELNMITPQRSKNEPLRLSDNNMSVLIYCDDSYSGQVSAYAGELLVGSGDVVNGTGGFAVWGDDDTTPEKEGLLSGESFELRFENGIGIESFEILTGNGLIYETDAFTALQIEQDFTIPQDYYLSNSFPNPFNNTTTISYGLPESGAVTISIFDLNGRSVKTLLNQKITAGHHSITWNAEAMGSGTYLIKMQVGSFSSTQKVVMIK